MKRRTALLSGVGATVAAATAGCAQMPAAAAGGQKERIVIQVSTPEPRMWNQALNYLDNLREAYGPGQVELELVALGMGIGVLKLDATQATRVAQALKAGALVSACENTMRRQKLTRADMLPDIGYVPAGLGQIIKRQREGWAYISG